MDNKKITMEFTNEELAFLQWAMIVTKVEAQSDLERGIGSAESAQRDIERADDLLKRFGREIQNEFEKLYSV